MGTCDNCGTPTREETPPLPVHPLPDLLETNDVPQTADLPLVRHDLLHTETRLSVVKAEVPRLQDILSRLASEEQALEKRLNANHGLISALRRLPNELLSHIFIDCLPDEIEDIHPMVLRLGGVCHKWWTVALSTPQLWTSVYPGRPRRRGRFFAVNVWIQRSGSLPLSLKYNHRYTPKLARLIISYISRWELLDVVLRLPHFREELAKSGAGASGGFPSLRSLSVNLIYETDPAWDLGPSPLLRELSYINEASVSSIVNLPWGQLTHLTLRNRTPRQCFSILSDATNLVECTLIDIRDYDENWEREEPFAMSPVLLPHLRRFHMAYSSRGAHSVVLLFTMMTAPALQDFGLSCSGSAPPNSFLSFLERSQCKLTRLLLDTIDIPEGEFIESLCRLSSLRELDVASSSAFGNLAISTMIRVDNSPNLDYLPALQILNLCYVEIDPECLAKMLRSRWRPGGDPFPQAQLAKAALAPLKSVQFYYDESSTVAGESKLEPLRALKREGFDIELPELPSDTPAGEPSGSESDLA
ncbi:hypothetical protein PLICRDRAFT_50598 [Plicaturopsis crispa FD-325 SS-3]|nr:hypothetical protein PLICRDRAFT_50598 [Plicaturopsis crispa FD-325 SS-3]